KKQMRDFLTKKGYTEAVINYVFERLEYYKLLDDEAYCRAYVNSVSGKGKRALEADLYKRGAEKAAIETVLSETEEDAGAAFSVLEKYMRGKAGTKENLYKGLKYLLSKGFGYDTAKEALEKFGDIDEDY
ncbi:MAG: RecX family transcriptional regulator, partial [Clostridia bacterium]|nr:RecX family transcriptional regulator [Clostridia bacterium]